MASLLSAQTLPPLSPVQLQDTGSDSEHDECWICLSSKGLLTRPCDCPRVCHRECIATWQLTNYGRREENFCRFCNKRLPALWKPDAVHDASKEELRVAPVMAVRYNGPEGTREFKLRVRPGPEGLAMFKAHLKEILGFDVGSEFDVTFECQMPATGSLVTLSGLNAYGAATHCAALLAASKTSTTTTAAAGPLAAQQPPQPLPPQPGLPAAAPSAAAPPPPAASFASPARGSLSGMAAPSGPTLSSHAAVQSAASSMPPLHAPPAVPHTSVAAQQPAAALAGAGSPAVNTLYALAPPPVRATAQPPSSHCPVSLLDTRRYCQTGYVPAPHSAGSPCQQRYSRRASPSRSRAHHRRYSSYQSAGSHHAACCRGRTLGNHRSITTDCSRRAWPGVRPASDNAAPDSSDSEILDGEYDMDDLLPYRRQDLLAYGAGSGLSQRATMPEGAEEAVARSRPVGWQRGCDNIGLPQPHQHQSQQQQQLWDRCQVMPLLQQQQQQGGQVESREFKERTNALPAAAGLEDSVICASGSSSMATSALLPDPQYEQTGTSRGERFSRLGRNPAPAAVAAPAGARRLLHPSACASPAERQRRLLAGVGSGSGASCSTSVAPPPCPLPSAVTTSTAAVHTLVPTVAASAASPGTRSLRPTTPPTMPALDLHGIAQPLPQQPQQPSPAPKSQTRQADEAPGRLHLPDVIKVTARKTMTTLMRALRHAAK